MDAFEQAIAQILDEEGYWTRTSYKVELTKEEKRAINRPSSPRWEIDVIAYRPGNNLLLAIECKSYLDSRGVNPKDLAPSEQSKSRYKLFTDSVLRDVILNRLALQLVERKLAPRKPRTQLVLAAGKVQPRTEGIIERELAERGHGFFGPTRISEALIKMADRGYENEVATVVAKIILRNPKNRVALDKPQRDLKFRTKAT